MHQCDVLPPRSEPSRARHSERSARFPIKTGKGYLEEFEKQRRNDPKAFSPQRSRHAHFTSANSRHRSHSTTFEEELEGSNVGSSGRPAESTRWVRKDMEGVTRETQVDDIGRGRGQASGSARRTHEWEISGTRTAETGNDERKRLTTASSVGYGNQWQRILYGIPDVRKAKERHAFSTQGGLITNWLSPVAITVHHAWMCRYYYTYGQK